METFCTCLFKLLNVSRSIIVHEWNMGVVGNNNSNNSWHEQCNSLWLTTVLFGLIGWMESSCIVLVHSLFILLIYYLSYQIEWNQRVTKLNGVRGSCKKHIFLYVEIKLQTKKTLSEDDVVYLFKNVWMGISTTSGIKWKKRQQLQYASILYVI